MNKTIAIYVGVLLLFFVGIIALEFSVKKPIDWTKTFNETHKTPYGTYILFNELKSLFPYDTIQEIKVSPYEYFNDNSTTNDNRFSRNFKNYINIENDNMDELSAQKLLEFASNGNEVFIASSYPLQILLDSLHIEIEYQYNLKGNGSFYLTNTHFNPNTVDFPKGIDNTYFSQLDSTTTTVLGYIETNFVSKINFIKANYGKGSIYLHLHPIVFTNYYLLEEDTKTYASNILSYLPNHKTLYDCKDKWSTRVGRSYLRFILKQPPLKWAWFLALICLLLFLFFNAKRKQRIIRVIKPLTNTTLDFIRTIGNLYYETKDHKNLISKKIIYFLEHIRRVYYLDTQILDEKFMRNLALKSNHTFANTKKLINLIVYLRSKPNCTEQDLLRLNILIEHFHNKE